MDETHNGGLDNWIVAVNDLDSVSCSERVVAYRIDANRFADCVSGEEKTHFNPAARMQHRFDRREWILRDALHALQYPQILADLAPAKCNRTSMCLVHKDDIGNDSTSLQRNAWM
jgi:hypothetical protein